jgi:hypothetical protein
LPWQPVMNKGCVAIQRAGGYNVLVVDLHINRVPRLAAKIPGQPGPSGWPTPIPTCSRSGLTPNTNEAGLSCQA